MGDTGDQTRKTISLTHKQAGISAVSIMTLSAFLAGPLSKFFQTKEDAAKQSGLIAVQASQIVDLKVVMEANKKEIIESFNSVVKPIAKDVDRHEVRIVNLEFIEMNKPKGK